LLKKVLSDVINMQYSWYDIIQNFDQISKSYRLVAI